MGHPIWVNLFLPGTQISFHPIVPVTNNLVKDDKFVNRGAQEG